MVSTGFLAIGFGVVVEVVEGYVFFNDSKQFSIAGFSSPQHHTCLFSPSQIWFLNCENKGLKCWWFFGSRVSWSTSFELHEHVEKGWQLQGRVRHESSTPRREAKKQKLIQ